MKPAVSIAHPKAHNANAVNSCKRFIVFSTDLYFPQISRIITDKRISVNQCNPWEIYIPPGKSVLTLLTPLAPSARRTGARSCTCFAL